MSDNQIYEYIVVTCQNATGTICDHVISSIDYFVVVAKIAPLFIAITLSILNQFSEFFAQSYAL